MGKYSTIHSSVSSNYEKAITNYNNQKKAFLYSLKKRDEEGQKDFFEALTEAMASEAIGPELEVSFDKAFNEISEQIESFYVELINRPGRRNKSAQQLIDAFQKKLSTGKEKATKLADADLENFYKRMMGEIETFLTTNKMTRDYVHKVISQCGASPSGSTKDVIINQFYGYARRAMFSLLTGQSAHITTTRYKSSLAGYYREDLLVNALNSALKQSELKAYGTGAIPNEKGEQIEIDIFITKQIKGNSENILKELEQQVNALSGIEASASNEIGIPTSIGMQSKSWVEPWLEGKGRNQNFLSVGHRTQLLNSLKPEGLFSWHEGILLASENLEKIIGINNVLFSTGAGPKWTADLIKDFKDNNMYLAFYISTRTHQATGEVVWDKDKSKHC